MNFFENDSRIGKTIISEADIKQKVRETGKFLSEKYNGKPLLLISILKGAFIFLADICRELTIPCEIGFMRVKSYYEGTSSSGDVKILMDIDRNIENYHVVVIEDIIDTGRTLHDVVEILKSRKPLSLEVVTLLDKPERRLVDFGADRSLFTIPDLFVVGYGLDCGENYRNLPYIAEYIQK